MKTFSESIKNLDLANQYSEPYDKVIEKGILTLFVECFDNSCIIMRTILENQGYGTSKLEFPKWIIDASVNLGLIKEEKLWFELLSSKISISSSGNYSTELAKKIIRRIKNKYIRLFKELEDEINENWLDDIDMTTIETIQYRGLIE